MHLLFFQFGSFAEAYERLCTGGPETFRDQRASVEYVSALADTHDVTTVAVCDTPHDTVLAPGLRSIGVRYQDVTPAYTAELFTRLTPDLFFCRTPHYPMLSEAARRGVRTLPFFADSFSAKGLRGRYGAWKMRRLLQRVSAPCLTNHGRNASLSAMRALGWPQTKVVPWDHWVIRSNFAPKTTVPAPKAPRLFFAGALSEAKGLGDTIAAVRILKESGVQAQLTVAGRGDWAPWQSLCDTQSIADQIHYAGLIPNAQMVAEMRAHDLVLVPSRHEYAEGLPNTLCEGLASRSPIVVSDHPSFADRLQNGRDAMIFRAANAGSLADAVQQVCQDPALYARLSANTPDVAEHLRFGMLWDALWTAFIDDPEDKTGWVARNSLAHLLAQEAA